MSPSDSQETTNTKLGVASGAALLRLTETGSSNPYVGRFHQLANGSVPDVSSVLAPVQLGSYVDAYFQTYHLCYPMGNLPKSDILL